MKTKLFTALLCAMCIGLIGCSKNGNDPESPSSNVGVRQAAGYTIYEVTIDGKQMWFSRKTDATDTTRVYLTNSFAFYQVVDDTKKYSGDFVVPASFDAFGVTRSVVGLQEVLGSSSSMCPFSGCGNLTSVTLPSSMTFIPSTAFATGCTNLKEITLPNTIDSIAGTAINCKALEKLTIPASVKVMGGGALTGCSALTELTLLPTTPPSSPFPIMACNALTTIYVPSSSVTAYKGATGWSDHAAKITAIP